MTLTTEVRPTTESPGATSWPEAPEDRTEPPTPMDEFAALLAQSYALMPLFA